MSETVYHVRVRSDSEGCVTFQCPFCDNRFKLSAQDAHKEDLIFVFCPYCGLQKNLNDFLSDEVVEHLQTLAANEVKKILNQSLKKLQRSFQGNQFIKVKAGKPLKLETENLLFEREEMELTECRYCGFSTKVKALLAVAGVYCPYCGTG